MKLPMSTPIQLNTCLLIGLMILTSCSSSSESKSSVAPGEASAENSNDIVEDSAAGGEVIASDGNTELDDPVSSTPDEVADETSGADESMFINSSPVVPDPMTLINTRVNFEIIVPAYQSDVLNVGLIWGESNMTAMWIGDELWSASAELPIDTENLLTITFYDNNGDIELASYENMYRTGSNAAELFQVAADQFNTVRWDADEDGISNFDELASGTDPLVNESLSLEVRDKFYLGSSVFFAETFAARIPAERPYNFFSEISELPENCDDHCAYLSRNIHEITIDVDADGNGTIYDFHETGSLASPSNVRYQATRTISESSIDWEGSRYYFNEASDGWVDTTNFTNVVSAMDANTRSYIGKTNQSSGADYTQGAFSSEHNLTGKLIEESTQCESIAGSIILKNYYESVHHTTTTITKRVNDAYWKVSVMNIADSDSSEEYFVRSIDSAFNFNCDLTDLQ